MRKVRKEVQTMLEIFTSHVEACSGTEFAFATRLDLDLEHQQAINFNL